MSDEMPDFWAHLTDKSTDEEVAAADAACTDWFDHKDPVVGFDRVLSVAVSITETHHD